MTITGSDDLGLKVLSVPDLSFDHGMTLFTVTLKRPYRFHLVLLFKGSALAGYAVKQSAQAFSQT